MYQTRAKSSTKLPIPRKGTKYIAKALVDPQNSVPVVIAVRDMLKLARTSKEVKEMIKQKLLRINGKDVKDVKDSIRLFNIFKADKIYILTLLSTGRFTLEETKEKNRLCKVLNKTMLKGKKIQLNCHDGSNIISDNKIKTHDTIYLDDKGKITKHVPFEKGKECVIISGKYIGKRGKILSLENGKAKVKFKDKEAELNKGGITIL